MNIRSFALAAVLFGLVSLAAAAENETISGVITGIDVDRGTVTILNERTGARRTYFVTDNTRVMSRGEEIGLMGMKRGMYATARFADTDTGREVATVDVPDPANITDISAIDSARTETITGEVTGIRRAARTITIREEGSRTRRTLNVPDTTRIMRRGNLIGIEDVRPGDYLTARYRESAGGPVLVSTAAAVPEIQAAPERQVVAAAQPAELPKTAGNGFWYLLAGVGMLVCAAVLRMFRMRGASG